MDYGIIKILWNKKQSKRVQNTTGNTEENTSKNYVCIGENIGKNGESYTDKRPLSGGKKTTWTKCVLTMRSGVLRIKELSFHVRVSYVETTKALLTTRIIKNRLMWFGCAKCTTFNITKRLLIYQNNLCLLVLLAYPQPQPAQAEPVPQVYQISEQAVGLAVSPITTASISAPEPQSPKSGDLAKRQKTSQAKPNQPSQPTSQKRSKYACNCQKYAANELGISFGAPRAASIKANSSTPEVGVAVLTRENSYGTASGHVAIVEKVTEEGIYVKEANYIRCAVTSGRFIAFNSGKIRGYWKKNPV